MFKLVLTFTRICMKSFILLFTIISAMTVFSQRPNPDVVETDKGPLSIHPVYHGSLMLNWNEKTVYVDPYGGIKAYKGLTDPDLVLLTDIHPDHLDTSTLNHLNTSKAVFVAPQAVAELLPEQYKSNLVILANGESTEQLGISITAIPMYNLREEAKNMHTPGRGNGYLLKFSNKTVYISGDTEDIPEMRELKNIDVAFVCMNLPYTMTIEQAASAVLDFKPAIVYPYHYRGKEGFSDTAKFGKLVKKGNKEIEVRLRNWYPDYE